MSEYSQEEVTRLAAEVKGWLQERAAMLEQMGEYLAAMAEQYQPGHDYDGLRRQHATGWLLELNHYDELTLDMTGVLKTIGACNDEHSGLLWERENPEEVAS